MLWKLTEDLKGDDAPTHMAVIFDYSSKTFRDDIYPDYKAHRPPAPEELVPQFPLTRSAARAFSMPCIEMEGWEADDIIATYACMARDAGAKVTIVSSDKDLMQLVEPSGSIRLHRRGRGPRRTVDGRFTPAYESSIRQNVMTDCTERQPRRVADGAAREGQKGMTKKSSVMTDCTERQPRRVADGAAREGQKGMTKKGSAP